MPVPEIRNPRRGFQNPRLSWITLHRVMPCFNNFLSSLAIDVCGVLHIKLFLSFLFVLLSLLLIDDPAKGWSVFFPSFTASVWF